MNSTRDHIIIIKSDKMWLVFLIILCSAFLWYICLLGDVFSQRYFVDFAVVCLSILCLRYWIVFGRTLKMSAQGCEVSFLFIRRFYKWQDLDIRFEYYSHRVSNRQPYSEGVLFSPKKISKPDWMLPATYCLLVHPFSFFFVYFYPRKEYNKWVIRYPDFYAADKTELLGLLKAWGVLIQ